MKIRFLPLALGLVVFVSTAHAQWLTQTFALKGGWNAVFLHVDASHATLDQLVGDDISNPIIEVWRWNPPATTQFTESPQNPNRGSEWLGWVRIRPGSSLQRLMGDSAYLIRVGTNVTSYTWTIKGRPVPPRHAWTVTGLNFLGFPTAPVAPPNLEAFLAQSPDLRGVIPEVYQYPGGELGAGNPMKLPSSLFRAVPAKRGQAFWIRAGEVFNQYFGPFEVVLNGDGINFRDNTSATSLRLRNLTGSPLTITMALAASETPPTGQPAIAGLPPMLIRGALNPTNLTHGYAHLPSGSTHSWTLSERGVPGSEIEVVLGLNRSVITAAPGSLLAGLLRFSDSLGHLQVDVPLEARASSSAGLWIGGASVNQVQHYLKSYERDGDNNPVVSSNGNYVVTGLDTSLGDVPRAFPLRLIVHNPEVGNAVLLQRVFHGLDASTNQIISLGESAVGADHLDDARRISAVHLPWTPDNTSWQFNGRLGPQASLSTLVIVGYNDRASNPFVHSYHPDHDNLNPTFDTALPQGSESYSIRRNITLHVTPPADNFSSLVSAGLTLSGEYSEVITLRGLSRAGSGIDTRQFQVRGVFSLNRISEIPALTLAP